MVILFKGGVVTPPISIVKNYHAVILDQLIRLNESSLSGSSIYQNEVKVAKPGWKF